MTFLPLVRIEGVRPRWPLFGRQRTLNVATYCAPVNGISVRVKSNETRAGNPGAPAGTDPDMTAIEVYVAEMIATAPPLSANVRARLPGLLHD